MLNLNKNLKNKLNNLVLSCLIINLLSTNLMINADWRDWFSTAKTTAVELSTEHPVKAGCAVGATIAVSARMLDRRAGDERVGWGTVALLGATVGIAAWYKLTSDRDQKLTADVAKKFELAGKQSKELGAGITNLAAVSTQVRSTLDTAQATVTTNQAALEAAQAAADRFLSAISQTGTKITSLQAEFERQNAATQAAILARLAAAGISHTQALAQIKTGDLDNLLAQALVTQTGLTAQCERLEAKVQAVDSTAQKLEQELLALRAAAVQMAKQ